MVISQQLIQKVNRISTDKPLILRVHEALPALLGKSAEDVVILRVQLDVVLVQIIKQVLRAEHLCDLDELVRVGVAVEEGLLAEDHGREHGAQRPHVERVVVLLEVDEQLGAFEVARRDPDVVLCALVVEFGETPVDQS